MKTVTDAPAAPATPPPAARVWRSKTAAILAVALVLVAGLELVARAAVEPPESFTDRLVVPPVRDGVYLVGNSMFKTGVDVDELRQRFPGEPVDFAYYDGHYTSLWYLIAKTAFAEPDTRPGLVVWGFRPAFARDPLFRQNRPNATDLFAFDDPDYLRLGDAGTGGSALASIDAYGALADSSVLFAERNDVRDWIADTANRAGVSVLEAAGAASGADLRERVVEGDRSVADEIVLQLTGGAVQLTEEQVVDDVGDFVSGPQRRFADGFIPRTARAFQERGLDQLVVIWRPANAIDGAPAPEDVQFVADAIAWFEANDVPYLNLYDDPRLLPEHLASGDHYNAQGREVATAILGDRLAELGVGSG